MTCVQGVLYAWENLQGGVYPDVDCRLDWSTDLDTTWQHSRWLFPKGPGRFEPATFLSFGQDAHGVPRAVGARVANLEGVTRRFQA